jgi:hypothetical protein
VKLGWGGGEPPRGGSISGYAIKGIIGLGWVEVPIIVIEGGGYVGVTVEVNKYVVLSPRIPTFWAIPILAAITVGCQRNPPPVNFGLYDFRADMVRGQSRPRQDRLASSLRRVAARGPAAPVAHFGLGPV